MGHSSSGSTSLGGTYTGHGSVLCRCSYSTELLILLEMLENKVNRYMSRDKTTCTEPAASAASITEQVSQYGRCST